MKLNWLSKINASEIYFASDHAGFLLKDFLIKEFEKAKINSKNGEKIKIIDLGCDSEKISVDYPDYAKKLAYAMPRFDNQNQAINIVDNFGILICGTGVGISIGANRYHHLRSALCHKVAVAKLAREHNNANVLCLGARIIKPNIALAISKAFLTTKFLGCRHESRIIKLSS
jgi:ribose 5-phosphate isomerase B